MQQPKELHLTNNIEELNLIAAYNNKKAENCKKALTLMNIAKKLYHRSQLDPYDEEMTYIILLRFIKVYDQLSIVSNDPLFVSSILYTEVRNARIQIENLKNNLISRYEEASLKKIASIKFMPTSLSQEEEHKTVFSNASFISCSELLRAFSDKNLNLLVMDIRSEKDFAESRIKDLKCINIPESLIYTGLSAYSLGLTLSSSCMEQWNKRDSFDAIVLMDWNTCKTNFVASKLDKLRTILVEWDVEKKYKSKPTVLNEGYLEWLEMYPMYCTDSDVKYSKVNTDLDDLLNLDEIKYPTNSESKSHEVFKENLEKEVAINRADMLSRDEILEAQEVAVQKAKEVAKELLKFEHSLKNIDECMIREYDISKLKQLREEKQKKLDLVSKLTEEEARLLKQNLHLANHFNLVVSFEPVSLPYGITAKVEDIYKLQTEYLDIFKARMQLTQERQRLLDEARQAKKPRQIPEMRSSERPTINRATKPKAITSPSIISHIDGKLEAVECGLTGLTNIRNTCYMNTIIQCLRHVPEIIEFYCNGIYTEHVHRSPPIISNEVAHLVRALWSNFYSVIKPVEFYAKFTSLSQLYSAGYHEDCMEFFLQLYNYLSDDCASDVVAKNFWSETQIAWHKQHGGKKSFFINIFYHQIRIQYYCKICKTSNLKFDIENIFYLSVPNKFFTLKESMRSYLNSKEQILCKRCQNPKQVDKQISFYPTVLVIALKRHMQDFVENGTAHYRKNENECFFPIDNFKVGDCFYKLHAIALHVGNMQNGHYTAVCLNPTNNKWYVFNDGTINEVYIYEPSLREKAYAFFYSLKKKGKSGFVYDDSLTPVHRQETS